MKSQTISDDLDARSIFFKTRKEALLKVVNIGESEKHPILRVKYKITFYWK